MRMNFQRLPLYVKLHDCQKRGKKSGTVYLYIYIYIISHRIFLAQSLTILGCHDIIYLFHEVETQRGKGNLASFLKVFYVMI